MDNLKLLWVLPVVFILTISGAYAYLFHTRDINEFVSCFGTDIDDVEYICKEKTPFQYETGDDYIVYKASCYITNSNTHNQDGWTLPCGMPDGIDDNLRWRVVDCASEESQEDSNQRCLDRLNDLPEEIRQQVEVVWRKYKCNYYGFSIIQDMSKECLPYLNNHNLEPINEIQEGWVEHIDYEKLLHQSEAKKELD